MRERRFSSRAVTCLAAALLGAPLAGGLCPPSRQVLSASYRAADRVFLGRVREIEVVGLPYEKRGLAYLDVVEGFKGTRSRDTVVLELDGWNEEKVCLLDGDTYLLFVEEDGWPDRCGGSQGVEGTMAEEGAMIWVDALRGMTTSIEGPEDPWEVSTQRCIAHVVAPAPDGNAVRLTVSEGRAGIRLGFSGLLWASRPRGPVDLVLETSGIARPLGVSPEWRWSLDVAEGEPLGRALASGAGLTVRAEPRNGGYHLSEVSFGGDALAAAFRTIAQCSGPAGPRRD